MDFYQSFGLGRRLSELTIPSIPDPQLPFAPTPVINAIINTAVPKIIAEKLLRLERYCYTDTRLLLLDSHANTLLFNWDSQVNPHKAQAHLHILQKLLTMATFRDVHLDFHPDNTDQNGARAQISWSNVAAPEALFTGESADLTSHLRMLIAADPSRAWRIEEAAAHMGLSARSLQRYLLSEGGTFTAALRQVRTEKAQALLRKGKISLGEIGYCCGYSDQAHFQREFRKTTGKTPRRYRQAAQVVPLKHPKKVS